MQVDHVVTLVFELRLHEKRRKFGFPPWLFTMRIFLKPLRAISAYVASSKSQISRAGRANVPGSCRAS